MTSKRRVIDHILGFSAIASMRRLSLPVTLLVFNALVRAAPAIAASDKPIYLYFEERAPYSSLAPDGTVSGLVAAPAERAFRTAGIRFEWVPVPFKRQLAQLSSNAELACGIGFFRTAEREKTMKFSSPIYRDGPTVILANLSFQPRENTKLADAIAGTNARMLLKEASTYGPFIDETVAKVKPDIVQTTAEMKNMALMITAGRADYMLITREEAQQMIDSMGEAGKLLHIMLPSDMPLGQNRHLMCSRQVPDDVIEKLNRAIQRR